MAYEPFKTNTPEFKELVPEFTGDMNKLMEDFTALKEAAQEQFRILNGMKDDGDDKKVSPTALARRTLIQEWEAHAHNYINFERDAWKGQTIAGEIVSKMFENPKSASAYAEELRALADNIDFIGELHVQDLRNEKFAGSSETDGDAVHQREVVGRLIENTKTFGELAKMFGVDEKVIENADIPSLRGNKVGTSSTGVRQSSAYPVMETQMIFSIDGEELPPKTGFSHAVINYLFPKLGTNCLGMDIEHGVLKPLQEENKNWTKPGSETRIFFEDEEGENIEFKVVIKRKLDDEPDVTDNATDNDTDEDEEV